MATYDITLLTESRYEHPAKIDWYIQQILTEDGLVQEALERKGLKVNRMDWARPDFDWSSTHFALFRTTWDYFDRFPEFSKWLEQTATQTQFINSLELIRWNLDKHYLRDLQKKGINIPPTRFIERGSETSLQALHAETGWRESVLKPTVSGAGRHTYRLTPALLDQHEELFQKLIAQEDMMLQEFQQQVVEKGESALIIIDGQCTHAVLKVAKKGDFRVQDDFGGTVHPYTPLPAEVELAEQIMEEVHPRPVYARVDLIYDNNGKPAVGELELIEPELWFRMHPPAADQLAEGILKLL